MLRNVCSDYNLGEYRGYREIEEGYEDINLALETSSGDFLVKIFRGNRDDRECRDYVEVMDQAVQEGVKHPEVLEHGDSLLYRKNGERLCVMEYIHGSTLEGGEIDRDDIKFFARQAALINSLDLEPHESEDSWAIPNFPRKLEKTRPYLDEKELELLEPLLEDFRQTDTGSLPHRFVHSDIRETNVMRDMNGELWILDFSVAGKYPRVQELAVIASTLLISDTSDETADNIDLLVETYREEEPLTEQELDALPLLIDVGCAMNYISAKYEKEANGVSNEENEHWLEKGRTGLEQRLKQSM